MDDLKRGTTVAEFRGLRERMQSADSREGLYGSAALVAGVFGAVLWLVGAKVLWGAVLLAVCGTFIVGLLGQIRRRPRRKIPRRISCPACGKKLHDSPYAFALVASRRCGHCGEQILAD